MIRLFVPAEDFDQAADQALVAAAALGDEESTRRRLQQGVPIDGWDPQGRTALMIAAGEGQVGVFQMLLDAGADPYLETRPGVNALGIALENGQQTIAQVWAQRGLANVPSLEFCEQIRLVEQPDLVDQPQSFGAAAASQPFQDALGWLENEYGWPIRPFGRPNKEIAGVYRIDFINQAMIAHWLTLQSALRNRGFLLIKGNCSLFGVLQEAYLFPTDDKYAVLRAMGVNGENYGLSTEEVIEWLKELDRDYPFDLTGAQFDFLEGRLLQPVFNAAHLADRIYDICPDIVDQGCGSVYRLAEELECTGRFILWWD